jgi:outer membrane protein insertion porin family
MGMVMAILLTAITTAAAAGGGQDDLDAVPSSSEVIVIHALRIAIDAEPERQPRYRALARRIVTIEPGDRLSAKDVDAAVDALRLSNRFSEIHVDMVSEAGGDVLVFRLKPYRYIKDIRIKGKYPLFERDILNQMTLYPGDPYTREDLSAQIRAIEKRYQREGYVKPQVSVSADRAAGGENAVIEVAIDKGPHYVLGALSIQGNRGLSTGTLKMRMGVWRAALVPLAGRFSEFRLKADMKSLLSYYRRKGFADAKLSYDIGEPDERYRVDVTVNISEGRRYRVDFEGNQQFWDLTLKKDVAIFTDGNRSNVGVRKSTRNMLNRYRQAGYMDARIQTRITDPADQTVESRHLCFVIDEGPRTLVDHITIIGNQAIDEKEVRKQLLTRPPSMFHSGAYHPETVDEDLYAVTTLYKQRGFQQRTVNSEVTINDDKTAATVALKIDEGPQTRVDTVTINGLTIVPEPDAREKLILKTGEPFRQSALDVDKETLTGLVSEQGYPHATVTAAVTTSDDHKRADVVFDVDPGPLVTLGDVFISGNLRTRSRVIRRELAVESQAPLSLRRLHDGQRQLRDLAIFHGVGYRTFGLKEKEETVNVFVEVEENKPYYVELGGGYESDSGLFGRARAGDRNLFGLNKDLWASGEVSETGHRVETRLTEPRFLGTRTTATIGVFNEALTEFNQPFGTRTTGGSLSFGRDLGKHVTTALSFRLERREQFEVDNSSADPIDEEPRTIFVTTPFIRYDSRDSFVRPTRGVYTSLGVDVSKGIENQLDDFVRYQFDVRCYVSPLKRITLAALARVGQVASYSDDEGVPDDQLFFLGGIRDVRGFKENLLRFDDDGNPVGGKTAAVGSLEARIDLGWNWELTTFFDIGSVQDAQVDGGSERFRPTVGIGLRYITPIGPMGLLYGHKLDREAGESAGRVHVSIGYSF